MHMLHYSGHVNGQGTVGESTCEEAFVRGVAVCVHACPRLLIDRAVAGRLHVAKQTEKKVKLLRTDNGMEFVLLSLMIIAAMKALLGTTPSHILLNRMVWRRE
jgi:hypothetical protein